MTQQTPDRNATRDANDGADPPEHPGLGAYDQSWAVVIGINDYQHYNKLQYAASDAVGVARMLIDRLQFPPGNVFLAVDSAEALPEPLASWLTAITPRLAQFSPQPTKEVIEDLLLTRLPARTGAEDRAVIYFAGHGKPRSSTSRDRKPKAYLVPVNARPGSWHEHIELRDLLAKSEDVPAKHVLYVIDACSSGLAGVRSATQTDRFEQSLLRKKARQCLTAVSEIEAMPTRGLPSAEPDVEAINKLLSKDLGFPGTPSSSVTCGYNSRSSAPRWGSTSRRSRT